MRRVEEMKKMMEKQMLEELEKQKQAEIKARREKEVGLSNFINSIYIHGSHEMAY